MQSKKVKSIFSEVALITVIGTLTACGGGGDSPPAPPSISTSSLPIADVNQPYDATFTASGSGPFTWSVTGGPQGLSVDAQTGKLTGAPTQVGTFNLNVEAKGPGGTDTEVVVLTIADKTLLVSVNSNEIQAAGGDSGNGFRDIGGVNQRRSSFPAVSRDARFVVFDSAATNLGAVNGIRHIFLRDRQKGETELISKTTSGVEANDDAHVAAVSDDGRFVAWDSYASNLVPTDTPDITRDVFLRDRQSGTTIRLSENPNDGTRPCPKGVGEPCNSFGPTMSADGNLIVLGSFAKLLPEDQNNDFSDLYLYRRDTKTLTLITKGLGGAPANGSSGSQNISADGRFVVFQSQATNLAANDSDPTPGVDDIFVYNIATGVITKISMVEGDPSGIPDGSSQNPTISENGSRIVFSSVATNLVASDGDGIRDIFIVSWNGIDGAAPTNFLRVADGVNDADGPSVSRDGQYLTFHRGASGDRKVFVMKVGTAPMVASLNSSGFDPANGDSRFPRISGDGRFIAFYSDAVGLVSPDSNGFDAFLTQRR